jgi:hypothetical protein
MEPLAEGGRIVGPQVEADVRRVGCIDELDGPAVELAADSDQECAPE